MAYLADSIRGDEDRMAFIERSDELLHDFKQKALRSGHCDEERLQIRIELMADLRNFVMRWRVCPLSLDGHHEILGIDSFDCAFSGRR